MTNKIALFTATPRSPTALLIAAATRCPLSHAAVCVNGEWYHASESDGGFGPMSVEQFANRHATVYEFKGDLTEWLDDMKGIQYDWRGIAGWAFKSIGLHSYTSGNARQFYCFEAALSAIVTARRSALWTTQFGGQLDNAIRDMYLTRTGETIEQLRNFEEDQEKRKTLGLPPVTHAQILTILARKVANAINDQPVAGCDIANLFTSGKFGRFGALQ